MHDNHVRVQTPCRFDDGLCRPSLANENFRSRPAAHGIGQFTQLNFRVAAQFMEQVCAWNSVLFAGNIQNPLFPIYFATRA